MVQVGVSVESLVLLDKTCCHERTRYALGKPDVRLCDQDREDSRVYGDEV